MGFTENLNYCMDVRGYTAYRLAKILNVNNQTVLNWQHGERIPHPKTREKIAGHFGITLTELDGNTLPPVKAEPIMPPVAEKSPPPEEGGLTQEFARIFDQLSPQSQNEIIAEMLRRQRQEQ